MEPWLTLLTNFGLATMILVCCGWAFWQTACWLGREIVLPARDHLFTRITAFFDRVDSTVLKLERNIESMNANLEQQTAALEAMRDNMREKAVALEELRKAVASLKFAHYQPED